MPSVLPCGGTSNPTGSTRLVIREGVGWRQAAILRSYAKYLQQLGTTNSYGFIADTLLANVRATHALLALFQAKFDPGLGRAWPASGIWPRPGQSCSRQ